VLVSRSKSGATVKLTKSNHPGRFRHERSADHPATHENPDDDLIFRLEDHTGQTLAQLKAAIDGGTVSPTEMERLGEFLYDKVFIGNVADQLRDALFQLERPYRLCIRIGAKSALLETIPWEYMRRPDGFVALGLASVTRVLEDRKPQFFSPVKDVSMLLVYANPPGYPTQAKHQQIDSASTTFIQKFRARLENSYKVQVTPLLRPDATRQGFLSKLSSKHFDIVHFIGHGEVQFQKGQIVMEDKIPIPGSEIASNLANPPPRLFYFNSCSTAKASGLDPFSSVAQALIRPQFNSVPAVVAMQYEIVVDDSFVMAEEFYDHLLNPESATRGNLEAAMDAARRRLTERSPSWGIPVLFLQTRERVMLFGEPPPEPQPSQLKLHLRSSIPPPVSDLINRDAEIVGVRDLLSSDQRLLIVTGLPGVGRGTVVRAGLDPYLQDQQEEIVIWLNLEGVKSEDATLDTLYLSLDRIIKSGLRPLWYDLRRPLGDKLQALEEKIPSPAILVLENMDTLLDEERRFRAEQLEQFFRHFARTQRRIFIITTSQFEPVPRDDANEWQLGSRMINVTGLKPEDAVLLLKREGLTQGDEQLGRLADALDGHPQALKIVATAIRREGLDPEQFLQAPQSLSEDLTDFFAGSVLGALSDRERTWLRVWSVFRNPVLREALADVAVDEPDAQKIIDSLQAKGILRVHSNYYFLPLLIRRIGYAELQRGPELCDAAHDRAALFFEKESNAATESSRLSPSPAADNEIINNLLEAQYHRRERSDAESKVRAQRIAEELFQTLMNRGRYRELEMLIEQSPRDISDAFKVELFKAQLKKLAGKSEEAFAILDLLKLRLEEGSFEQATVVNEMGVVLKERSDPRDADKMLEEFEAAYDLFGNVIKTSDDQKLMAEAHRAQAVTMYNRGLVYQYFRRGVTPEEFNDAYSKARELYQAALGIYQTLEERDEEGIALAFSQLGEMYADKRFKEHDPDSAGSLLREALNLSERAGNPIVEMDVAYQLARFLRRRGETATSRTLFRRVADQAARVDLLAEQAIAEVQIAEIDFKNNQYDRENLDRSLARYEERLGYYDDEHSIRVQSDAYLLHGLLHRAQKNRDRAKDLFESSRALIFPLAERSHGDGDAKRIARATYYLAEDALLRQGQDAASAIVVEQQQYFQRLGYQFGDGELVADFLDKVSPELDR
jgi:tetratricopeptide (TPR) repeat protein